MSHRKIPGFVTTIKGAKWWARLVIDGHEYEAEMSLPLPQDVTEGSFFTIHRPRRGDPYLYWIRLPVLTKHQVKLARKQARELLRLFVTSDGKPNAL